MQSTTSKAQSIVSKTMITHLSHLNNGVQETYPSRDAALRVLLTQILETQMNKAGVCPLEHTMSNGDKTHKHLRISAKRAS